MGIQLSKMYLNLRLFWNHLVFWTFPTPVENYYSNVGKIYFDDGNYKKAISYFLKSENAHGRRDMTATRYNSYYLGYSYWNLGVLREASSYFETYFRLNKKDFQIASMVGWYYAAMRKYETALEWYLSALTLEPSLLELRIESSLILAELGRKEEALKQLQEVSGIPQHPVDARILECIRRKVCGDLQGAIATLKNAILETDLVWNPAKLIQQRDAYIILFKFQREFGAAKEVLLTLESAGERYPEDPWLINEVAIEYGDQGVQLERALTLINRALRDQPENAIFLDTKGWVLFKLGRRTDAETVLERCLELLPDYQDAKEHYHIVSEANGATS